MNKTKFTNQKSARAINKLTARNLYWLDQNNKWNLWKIRGEMKHPYTQSQLENFITLTDQNNEDINEFLERYNWF